MDIEARMQRLEQAVLGIGTNNGLYREVTSMREEMAQGFDRMEKALAGEREERIAGDSAEAAAREAGWSGLYFRVAAFFLGALGAAGIAVAVAVLTR